MSVNEQILGPVIPPVTSGTAEWWDATRERRLTVQRCDSCGHAQLYPRSLCIACHGMELRLEDAQGHGEVLSFSVVHRSPDPERYRPPYTVGLVRLAEGPFMTTILVGRSLVGWRCEAPVRVLWEPLNDGRNIPLFMPINTEDDGGRPWTSH